MGIPIYFGTKMYGWHDNGDGTSTATQFFHIYYVPVFPLGSFRVLSHDPATGSSQVQKRSLHWGSMLGTYFKVWGFLGAIGLCIAAADKLGSAHWISGVVNAALALGLMMAVVAAWFWVGRQPNTPSTTARKVMMPILFVLPVLVMGWVWSGSARSGFRSNSDGSLFGLVNAKDAASFVKTMQKQELAKKQARCDQGESKACSDLAYTYAHGDLGIPKDPARSNALYGKACNAGEARSCATLGLALDEKEPARSNEIYLKGCDLGDAQSCNNAAVGFAFGSGVPKDLPRAMSLYEKACDGKEGMGCYNLGNLYRDGKGVKKDKSKAKGYYKKGCDVAVTKACDALKRVK